jgi:serine/threonine-protein kinase RsbW
MDRSTNRSIFSTIAKADLVGRDDDIERVVATASPTAAELGRMVVLAKPHAGASELLRQAYDTLYFGQAATIPFYFEFRRSDGDARGAAMRFLRDFLTQTVAFRRRDPAVISNSPEICEVAELATPADSYWIDRLVETCRNGSNLDDDRSFIRNCFSAPIRAANQGAHAILLIDAAHIADDLDGGGDLLNGLFENYGRSQVSVVVSGYRRALFGRSNWPTITLDALNMADAGRLIERLSARSATAINDQTRDLIALQLDGSPRLISSLVSSAADRRADLSSFDSVERVYTDEIFGGRIGRYYEGLFADAVPDAAVRGDMLKLIAGTRDAAHGNFPVAYIVKRLNSDRPAAERSLVRLFQSEIINISGLEASIDPANRAASDYFNAKIRLVVASQPRALAVGETLADNIRRAPQLMAAHYRRGSSIGLRELLTAFDGRAISPLLLDYGRFKPELKGSDSDKITSSLKDAIDQVELPVVTYTANAAAFYPQFADLCPAERAAVGLGYLRMPKKTPIAVLVAEIDSKLEAKRDVTDFWLDRLEMLAAHCGFENYRPWLIAPEGFDDEAMELLRSRRAYGSSRSQAELLASTLAADLPTANTSDAKAYEFVIPMGEDTEMIAAHTIEEIAHRHGIESKAINQIKTAVVEACINAAEHGHSPDRKIYQRYVVDCEKLVITISNRGVAFDDAKLNEITPTDGRRGWGLKLMKNLMDDVRLETVDDGTRVTMTKFLVKT